jgi:hypothetical protein
MESQSPNLRKGSSIRRQERQQTRDTDSWVTRRQRLKEYLDQLSTLILLLTGHCYLKGHLFKLGLTADPIYERCLEEDESAPHVLCDCEAIAHLRFRHLGQFFMEPGDYYDTPISRVLQFTQSARLLKGNIKKGKHNRSVMVAVQGPRAPPPSLNTHIHTLILNILPLKFLDSQISILILIMLYVTS